MITRSAYLPLLLLALQSPQALADRPAAMDEPSPPPPSYNEPEPAPMDDDMGRPAAEMKTTKPAEPVVTQQQTGDVLKMTAQPMRTRTLDFPRRGMTQDKVQKELGRPLEIVPAVGKPPISRWVYNDRIVYFEYSSVIHVVAK